MSRPGSAPACTATGEGAIAELLRAERLYKRFGHFTAINGVSLSLEAGRLTSIIGPNGAGKTTLVNLLTGSLRCDGGHVHFGGEDITRLPPHRRVRRGISRSFQITNIFQQMTVLRNVGLPVLARLGRAGRPWARPERDAETMAESEACLRDVGLWEARGVRAGALSHGDQRLLEIGMALASRPRLCFLDEPGSGLNPGERAQVQALIRRLAAQRDVTFLIIEHDMDMVFTLSDWIVVMHQGEVLTEDAPAAIREHRGVREIYLGEPAGAAP